MRAAVAGAREESEAATTTTTTHFVGTKEKKKYKKYIYKAHATCSLPFRKIRKNAIAMSNGDDVLDNWEEIDEAGVSIL